MLRPRLRQPATGGAQVLRPSRLGVVRNRMPFLVVSASSLTAHHPDDCSDQTLPVLATSERLGARDFQMSCECAQHGSASRRQAVQAASLPADPKSWCCATGRPGPGGGGALRGRADCGTPCAACDCRPCPRARLARACAFLCPASGALLHGSPPASFSSTRCCWQDAGAQCGGLVSMRAGVERCLQVWKIMSCISIK